MGSCKVQRQGKQAQLTLNAGWNLAYRDHKDRTQWRKPETGDHIQEAACMG